MFLRIVIEEYTYGLKTVFYALCICMTVSYCDIIQHVKYFYYNVIDAYYEKYLHLILRTYDAEEIVTYISNNTSFSFTHILLSNISQSCKN